MKTVWRFLILQLCMTLTAAAYAKSPDATVRTKVRTNDRQDETQKKDRLQFSGSIGYGISSDFAKESVPRRYAHTLLGGASLSVLDNEKKSELFYTNLDLAIIYTSLDNEIEKEHEAYQIGDAGLEVGKTFDLGKWQTTKNTLNVAGGSSIPWSTDSRYEGYRAIPYASLAITTKFFGDLLKLSQNLSSSFVVNTYEFSPVTLETNPDLSFSYGASLGIRIVRGLTASVGGSVKSQHYIDGTSTASWRNTQSVSYSFDRWSFVIRHENGNHTQDRNVNLWFIDQYRRVISFSIAASF